MRTQYKIIKRLITIYNQITSNPSFEFATHTLPTIKKTDYDVGYIDRYFLRQVNNPVAQIIEVNKKQWTTFLSNKFYTRVSLRWKISGRRDTVISSNRKSLVEASKVIPGILAMLENNLLQFYKP
jgi:hypothetical protein